MVSNAVGKAFSKWQTSDQLLVAILSLITVTLAARQLTLGSVLAPHTATHFALLTGFLIYRVWVSKRLAANETWRIGHDFATLFLLLSLYMTLAAAPFIAMPWRADPLLSDLDRWLFIGLDPSLFLEHRATFPRVEALSAAYALFIPYLYLSIFVGLLCRPEGERRCFVNGAVIVYSVSFVGYLFAPAMGPVVEYAGRFQDALPGGFFHSLVTESVARAGGPHGAFPSLHVGASLYLCLFDLRYNRLRGLAYLPFVLVIMGATVFLRYHWVVDIVAGAAIAATGFSLATRLYRPERRDVSADLPVTYRLVRLIWFVIVRLLWFRRCEAHYAAPFPKNRPVLICANHRNSFVDAFALIATTKRPVTLTAKDTLRRNPYLRVLIKLHGIITFHRRQDSGTDVERSNNADALEQCIGKLAGDGVVCLFPEGVSHSDPDMRAFQGGAARLIAAYEKTAAVAGWPELMVVPVGLNYDAKSNIRSNLLINFGVPRPASDYLGPATPDARLTAARRNEVTARLRREIAALCLNFDSRRQAAAIPVLGSIAAAGTEPPSMLGYPAPSLSEGYATLARLAAASDRLDPLLRPTLSFARTLRRRDVDVANVFLPLSNKKGAVFAVRETELMIVALPAAILGSLFHAAPLLILWLITRKLSQDEDHWATNFLMPAFTALPVWYGVIFAVVAIVASPLAALLFILIMLFCGYVALLYVDRLNDALRRLSTFFVFRRRPHLQRRLQEDMTELHVTLGAALGEIDTAAVQNR